MHNTPSQVTFVVFTTSSCSVVPLKSSSAKGAIHVHRGPAHWAARGPARVGMAQTRPDTTLAVPVPARHAPLCRAWANMAAHGAGTSTGRLNG
jgi:hypothetical protein